MPTDFTLPELGESISSGDVLRVLVKPGDTLVKDQPVLELETDKATIEVPSSLAGTVKEIKVKAGDKVKVGQVILRVEDDGAAAAPKSTPAKAVPAKAVAAANPAGDTPRAGAGGGESAGANSPSTRIGSETASADEAPARGTNVVDITRGARAAAEPAARTDVYPSRTSSRTRSGCWRAAAEPAAQLAAMSRSPISPAGAPWSGSRCGRSVARPPST